MDTSYRSYEPGERVSLETAIAVLTHKLVTVTPQGYAISEDGEVVDLAALEFVGAFTSPTPRSLSEDERCAVWLLNYLFAADLLHRAAFGTAMHQTGDAFERLAKTVGVDTVKSFKQALQQHFGVLRRGKFVEVVRRRTYAVRQRIADDSLRIAMGL